MVVRKHSAKNVVEASVKIIAFRANDVAARMYPMCAHAFMQSSHVRITVVYVEYSGNGTQTGQTRQTAYSAAC